MKMYLLKSIQGKTETLFLENDILVQVQAAKQEGVDFVSAYSDRDGDSPVLVGIDYLKQCIVEEVNFKNTNTGFGFKIGS